MEDETVWLTQAITEQLKNIFSSEELVKDSVCAKFAYTASDGKTYQVDYKAS